MFGEKLQILRKEKGLTQKDVADLLKVAPSTIGMYEQGRRDPDTDTIRQLAKFFNVSIDDLLGSSEISCKSPKNLTALEQKQLDEEAQGLVNNLTVSLSKNKEQLKPEDYKILEISIRNAIEAIMLKNKEKLTDKKI